MANEGSGSTDLDDLTQRNEDDADLVSDDVVGSHLAVPGLGPQVMATFATERGPLILFSHGPRVRHALLAFVVMLEHVVVSVDGYIRRWPTARDSTRYLNNFSDSDRKWGVGGAVWEV